MNRRTFVKLLPGGLIMLAAGLLKLLKLPRLRRFTRAEPAATYPGKIRQLDEKQIENVAPWSG